MQTSTQRWTGLLVVMAAVMLGTLGAWGENVLEFSGTDSYVDLGTPTALQIGDNQPFTVEGWMYLHSLSTRDTLYSKSATRPEVGPYTYIFGFRDYLLAAYDGGAWRGDFDVSHEINQWYHLAYSFDGAAMRYYLNGNYIGQSDFTFSNTEAHPVIIGGYHSDSDIDGRMSDVRVWDHARDASLIQAYMNYRLTGAESGLLGYWPMYEGSGTEVLDGSANDNPGTVVNAGWVVAADLDLPVFPEGFLPAPPFSLANITTGSTRFTNTNEVEVVEFPVPDGYDQYQITVDGDTGAVTGSWTSTNTPPPSQSFPEPAGDTNITLYAWFTNETDAVSLMRAEGKIVYTTVAPDPALHATLARETAGFTLRVTARDVNAGSTGGQFETEPLGIYSLEALYVNGTYPDGTPGEAYVTLTNRTGSYAIGLRVVNEAGTAATASSNCAVTVSEAVAAPADGDRYVAAGNLLAAAPYDTGTNAAASIQTAVNAAAAGETILVWPGRYTLPTNAVNHWDADNVVFLDKPLTIRSVDGREVTIIDGEGLNRGIAVDYADSTEHPLRFEGLTITDGYAPATGGGGLRLGHAEGVDALLDDCIVVTNATPVSGGGIQLVDNRSLIVSNSLVHGNTAGANGGGIHASGSGSALEIQGTTLSANEAGADGGGILSGGSATITDSLLDANVAERNGGGVYRNALVVTRSTFRGNSAGNEGGGVRGFTGAAFHLMDSTMEANTAFNGGGFYARSGPSTIENSIFAGNTATTTGGNEGGGAMSLRDGSATLRNSLFYQNSAHQSSVVYYHVTTSGGYALFIYNCTLVENSTSGGGAHVIRFRRNPSRQSYFHVFNSIICNNTASTLNTRTTLTDVIMSHNCHENDLSAYGEGNIDASPLFVGAAVNDYRLSRESPCVNAGTNMTWMAGAVDLAGNRRVDGTYNQVDIGAYEYLFRGTTILVR